MTTTSSNFTVTTDNIISNTITPDYYNTITTTTGTALINYNDILTNYNNISTQQNIQIIPSIDHEYQNTIKYIEKENKNTMNNEFNFGPYKNLNIRLSPYGIAIKNNNNKWISYNKNKNRLVDVDVFNIEINPEKVFFKVPKPIDEIASGDLICFNNILMFVEHINNNRITAIDPVAGEEKTILPATSPFGYDYISVIISLTDYLPEADEKNPFGNLLWTMLGNKDDTFIPYLLMSNANFKDIDPMLLLAASGNNSFSMLYFILANQKGKTKTIEINKKKNKINKEDIDE